jgi:hypothetical protein
MGLRAGAPHWGQEMVGWHGCSFSALVASVDPWLADSLPPRMDGPSWVSSAAGHLTGVPRITLCRHECEIAIRQDPACGWHIR